MFIDTHSHLYLGELQNHIPEAISHLRKANFSHTIQIGTSVDTSHTCIELAHTYDIVRATVGIHPCEAQDLPIERIPEQVAKLEKMIQEEGGYIAAFGEIGFDYYHLSKNSEEAALQKGRQFEWFHAQVSLAKKYNLGVVIHTRNCSDVTLRELEKSGLTKFVIHCFSEDWSFAEKIFNLSKEAKISFTGILTYPKSTSIREVAKQAPLERIMIETDAPFLTPEAFRGKVDYCEPVYTLEVFKSLCDIRSETPEKIEQQVWENSTQFFKI